MIVRLADGQGSIHINKKRGYWGINPGETKEVEFAFVQELLATGVLVKAQYPEIRNDEVVVVDTAEMKVRPVGIPKPRDGAAASGKKSTWRSLTGS